MIAGRIHGANPIPGVTAALRTVLFHCHLGMGDGRIIGEFWLRDQAEGAPTVGFLDTEGIRLDAGSDRARVTGAKWLVEADTDPLTPPSQTERQTLV